MMNNDPKRRLSRPEVSGISAIFNPRKLRRSSTAVSQLLGNTGRPPSVVITDDNLSEVEFGSGSMVGIGLANGPHSGGRSDNNLHSGILNAGGLGPSPNMQQTCPASSVPLLADVQQQSGAAIITLESSLINNNPGQLGQHQTANPNNNNNNNNNTNLKPIAKSIASIKRAIFSKTARKLCCGVILSILVGCCWTLMIHSIKRAYITSHLFSNDQGVVLDEASLQQHPTLDSLLLSSSSSSNNNNNNNNNMEKSYNSPPSASRSNFPAYENPNRMLYTAGGLLNRHPIEGSNLLNLSDVLMSPQTTTYLPKSMVVKPVYDAPFFTAWLLTISTTLFYPIHQMTVRFCSCMGRKGPKSMSRAISDAVQGFRERGMTLWMFTVRCTVLCFLWLLTNWLIVAALRVLRSTEVLSLFATTTSFVYLLSWVVLHQQFVGLRILAVIFNFMGIALFAYMDGQTHKSPTVGGVILGATAAASSAVFKVSLKKSFGFGATISQQVALIFSVVGLIAMVILWPIFLTLYFTGIEVIRWGFVPWELIVYAVVSSLLVSMLDNFGVTCTFEFFITVGLLMAIPFSADRQLYHAQFGGMCLAAIITVGIGFVVVLLPEDWPNYITRVIRRFRGEIPPVEEEKHPSSANTAHPRLSRSGLDNLLVNPPNFHSPYLNHHSNNNTTTANIVHPPTQPPHHHLHHHNNNSVTVTHGAAGGSHSHNQTPGQIGPLSSAHPPSNTNTNIHTTYGNNSNNTHHTANHQYF